MADKHESAIRSVVRNQIKGFAAAFRDRHLVAADDPEGTINAKVHNVFVSALGPEIQFYSALVRSLDSSLGTLIESMALEIAELHFVVERKVQGPLYVEQTRAIADLLQNYLTRRMRPNSMDYRHLRLLTHGEVHPKSHASDYLLRSRATGELHLIELKMGGDLDNKKARSEKEALLEQFCILSNVNSASKPIKLHFATAYNKYGESQPWKQERVRQFFADEELLIAGDFWNFLGGHKETYQIVLDEYSRQAPLINDALGELREAYIG